MTPKELFQSNVLKAQAHQRRVTDLDMQEALLAAFNELNWQLPAADNPQTSWAANARRQGAQDFINIFLSLGNPSPERKRATSGQLEREDATIRSSIGVAGKQPGK